MSKSRYSKTKAAGLMSGMSRIGNVKTSMARVGLEMPENRATRRMREKGHKQ